MYHAETDTPACARTSNLNEELGQVKYVFSDKTGTLTQNVMEFQQCSVGGTIYAANDNVIVNSSGMASSMLQDLTAKHSNAPYIREFLTLLAVCHTVIPEKDENQPELLHYHAASPGLHSLSLILYHFLLLFPFLFKPFNRGFISFLVHSISSSSCFSCSSFSLSIPLSYTTCLCVFALGCLSSKLMWAHKQTEKERKR